MTDRLSSDLASLRLDRDAARPRSGRWWKLGFMAASIVALVAAFAVFVPQLESRLFKPEVEATQIASISPAQAHVQLTSTGYVVPQRVSKIGSKVTGRIAKMLVHQGDKVEAGQVIAELEDTDQKATIAVAQAQVASARAEVQTLRAELAEAQRVAGRERKLAERGISPAATAEDLEARVITVNAQIDAAQARVKAAQQQVENLRTNLDLYKIVAPMSGTVINRPTEAGELVGVMAASLVELADFSSLMVETDVPEARLGLITLGAPAEIVLDAFPHKRFRGRVREISPRIDRTKATVTVKVEFVDETTGDVLPDMAGRVSFLAEELDPEQMDDPPKVVVPAAGLADRGGIKVVFVLDGDVVRMRPVQLGEPVASGFELISGPPAGTKIVRDPGPDLVDGQAVKQKGDS
jgi:RND family efflux transporter MFP subunit